MELFAAAGLINGVTAIGFGLLVIIKNWRERANQLFFLMTFSLAVWSFGYWQWLSTTDSYNLAFFWVRVLSVGSLFIPIFFFHWVTVLLNENRSVNQLIAFISYLAAVAISLTTKSTLFISSLSPISFFPFWPSAGQIYDVYFSFIYLGLVTYTFYLLCRSYYLTDDKNRRGQILFILLGAAIGFGGGLTNFPLWWGIPIPPYGNFLVAAFPFLLGYSVLHYHLFNAKSFATEILVFFISIILFTQAVLSSSVTELVLRGGFAIVVSVLGYLVIRSVYREIKQREQIEKLAKELEAANERLKELDELKTEFISFATHQIRGPLTAIKGYASLMLEGDYGGIPETLKDPIDKIYQSSISLAILVDDYLNVSRIEQGRMKYEFSRFDFGKLINEIVAEMRPSFEKKGLRSVVDVASEIFVNADLGKIKQVIANLIDNSIKYTPKGAVTISLKKDSVAKKAVVSVSDTGLGISKETIAKLFQKFSRAEDASKFNLLGTGLGLYLAKELVRAHSGRIWVESPGAGMGSTFFVELALA
jgi:signal transduction histidine kinase